MRKQRDEFLRAVPATLMAGALGLSVLGIFDSSAISQEPGRFQLATGARPLPTRPVRLSDDAPIEPLPNEDSSNGLRWKHKPVAGATQSSGSSTARRTNGQGEIAQVAYNEKAAAPRSKSWNKSRIDSTVMPAQYTAPGAGADPFRDPFGDRGSSNRAPSFVQSTQAEEETPEDQLSPTETAPEETMPAEEPMDLSRPETDITPPASSQPGRSLRPRPSGAIPSDPRRSDSAITPMEDPVTESALPPPSGEKCDRNYDGRDCCEADRAIERFRQQLMHDDITKISIDISPRRLPDRSSEEDAIKRGDMTRKAGSRQWKNYNGQLLATGFLSDIRHGKAEIANEGGTIVARINLDQLGSDETCFISGWYALPMEGLVSIDAPQSRNWIGSTYTWHASALCHKPLYFEDIQAERYGHTHGPFKQPFVSGAHYFVNIATLPYHMAINPPTECQYALGYYRPGSCAPYHIMPVPISLRAGIVQAGVMVGGAGIIP